MGSIPPDRRSVLAIVVTVVIGVGLAKAGLWHVPADFATIQAAVDAAAPGDTVVLADGVYPANVVVRKPLILGSRFLLDGDPAHVAATEIIAHPPAYPDSGSAVLVLPVAGGDIAVVGLTLSQGRGTVITRTDFWGDPYEVSVGGGVCCLGASLLVRDCVFRFANTDEGGGLYAEDSHGSVCDCLFEFNYGGFGGGLCARNSDLKVTRNEVRENSAWQGAGLAIAGDLQEGCAVRYNTVASNVASDHGGAIIDFVDGYTTSGPTTRYQNNLIEGNTAGMGGAGIYCRDTAPLIYRNLIVGNIAQNWNGGGIRCVRAAATILNNTLHGNSAPDNESGGGGGIYFFNGLYDGITPPVIANNIISSSSGPVAIRGDGARNRCGYNDVWGSEGLAVDFTPVGPHLDADPLFADAAGGEFSVLAGSPCIDAGTAHWVVADTVWVDIPPTEYGGLAPDLGAIEFVPTSAVDRLPVADALSDLTAHPNPFNPRTEIAFTVTCVTQARVAIYDLGGRRLAVVAGGSFGPGRHTVTWDGRDGSGRILSSGIYLVCIETDLGAQARKILLQK